MYEKYYGFKEKPFSLLPDPSFLYLSHKHKIAHSLIEYGLADQSGFTVISGDIGTGKTTLIRSILQGHDPRVSVGLVSNTNKSFGNLLQWILVAFDLDYTGMDEVTQHKLFREFLYREYSEGRRVVLIIDEAQNLDIDALEELRMLSNINADKHILLQMVLVGQPELLMKLKRPELVQFTQRVAYSYELEPLSLKDTVAYIRHRLTVAGGRDDIFSILALGAVHYFARGVPRLINTLCDNALLYGYVDEKSVIDLEVIKNVVEDKATSNLFTFRKVEEGTSLIDLADFLSDLMRGEGFADFTDDCANEARR